MNVGIIGSRRRNTILDKELIREQLLKIIKNNSDIVIISGGCPQGGDRFAEELASEYKIPTKIFYPDKSKLPFNPNRWDYTKIFYDRNTLVAEASDLLIACVSKDRKGGTEDTIKKYLKFKKDKIILV
jgi:hypothetical protein